LKKVRKKCPGNKYPGKTVQILDECPDNKCPRMSGAEIFGEEMGWGRNGSRKKRRGRNVLGRNGPGRADYIPS
jgi:hypothetical protein